ncbi:MAG: RluA family pseudouridine synthase [Burkholderiaceae bacterium]|nr:RluA family pseudouridine synthase [Burkholderiaceae bacterium]
MNGSGHEVGENLEEWTEDYIDQGQFSPTSCADVANQTQSFAFAGPTQERRLDQVMSQRFLGLSRSLLQRWILEGHVSVDGRLATKPSQLVRIGQVIVVAVPAPAPAQAWGPEQIDLNIIFEDSEVIVLNKPAGLVVHPAAGHPGGTLANGLLHHAPELAQVPRAGIVHRLDRDTSGLMVAAKTIPAQIGLVRQLQARTVKRSYLALVWGRPKGQTISTWFGRDPRDRQKMAVLPEGRGKEAITHIEPLQAGLLFGQEVRLVRCQLETGRTHQIRVHLENIGCPIVGETTYKRKSPHSNKIFGGKKAIEEAIPGQALHAQKLRFLHPITSSAMEFSCDPPRGFLGLLGQAGIAWGPAD